MCCLLLIYAGHGLQIRASGTVFPISVISTVTHGAPAKCVQWRNLHGIIATAITDSSTPHAPLALRMLRSE